MKKHTTSLRDLSKSDGITDAATTIADIGLDAVISGGALDGVPILGGMLKFYRATGDVRTTLQQNRIIRFLMVWSKPRKRNASPSRKSWTAKANRRVRGNCAFAP